MNEACHSCITRQLGHEWVVNNHSIDLNDAEDQLLVAAHPEHAALVGALALEHPERCEQIRAILHNPPREHKRVDYGDCAELALTAAIGPQDYSAEMIEQEIV